MQRRKRSTESWSPSNAEQPITAAINSRGLSINPRDIEEILSRHPHIFGARVIGRTNPGQGESIVSFIVPRKGCVLDHVTLDACFLSQMPAFKKT